MARNNKRKDGKAPVEDNPDVNPDPDSEQNEQDENEPDVDPDSEQEKPVDDLNELLKTQRQIDMNQEQLDREKAQSGQTSQ